MSEFNVVQVALTSLLSAGVVSAVVGTILKSHFSRLDTAHSSKREWKEASVSQLLGPMNMQFERTKRGFERLRKKNRYLEAKVIKAGNETIRDLLIENGHLIPPELLNDASRLVEHYDVWLEKFEKERNTKSPELEAEFIFVGPEGYPFPRDAEKRFKETFAEYWKDLYSDE